VDKEIINWQNMPKNEACFEAVELLLTQTEKITWL